MSDYCDKTCKKHHECACFGCDSCAKERRIARGNLTPEERIARLETRLAELEKDRGAA